MIVFEATAQGNVKAKCIFRSIGNQANKPRIIIDSPH